MSSDRDLDLARAEAAHWRQVVEWYASPAQWVGYTDDRGRENFTFRYGDDGGWVARQALRQWGILGDGAPSPAHAEAAPFPKGGAADA